jgi:hypothetical protein
MFESATNGLTVRQKQMLRRRQENIVTPKYHDGSGSGSSSQGDSEGPYNPKRQGVCTPEWRQVNITYIIHDSESLNILVAAQTLAAALNSINRNKKLPDRYYDMSTGSERKQERTHPGQFSHYQWRSRATSQLARPARSQPAYEIADSNNDLEFDASDNISDSTSSDPESDEASHSRDCWPHPSPHRERAAS